MEAWALRFLTNISAHSESNLASRLVDDSLPLLCIRLLPLVHHRPLPMLLMNCSRAEVSACPMVSSVSGTSPPDGPVTERIKTRDTMLFGSVSRIMPPSTSSSITKITCWARVWMCIQIQLWHLLLDSSEGEKSKGNRNKRRSVGKHASISLFFGQLQNEVIQDSRKQAKKVGLLSLIPVQARRARCGGRFGLGAECWATRARRPARRSKWARFPVCSKHTIRGERARSERKKGWVSRDYTA